MDKSARASTTSTKKRCGPGQPDPCPQPPGGRRSTVTAKPAASNTSYTSSKDSKPNLETFESDEEIGQLRRPEKYVPKPYTFRIPLGPSSKDMTHDTCSVKSPPFIYQLDHALAVIWVLFSKEDIERPLGIVQLQWALNFLKGIYNQKGEHPKDIALCIEAIQDQLIEQYAAMANVMPSKKKGYCGAYNCAGKNKKDKKNKTASNTSIKSGKSSRDSFFDDTQYKRSQQTMSKDVPFSVNYAEMIRHSPPNEKDSAMNVEQIYIRPNTSAITDEHSKFGRVPSDSLNPAKSMEFLQTIRRQQIDKVQTELKTLHLIEDYIAHSETLPEDIGPPNAASTPKKKSKIPKKGKI